MTNFEDYKRGAFALLGLAIIAYASTWFGSSSNDEKDPIVNAKTVFDAPVDNTPSCIANGNPPGPTVFASRPDPRGISVRYVFDRLVEYDRRSGKIIPGLATRWDVSDDGLSYTFYLRKHVNFQSAHGYTPTRAFNADDILFTFKRFMVKNSPFKDARDPSFADYRTVDMPSIIESITRQDAHIIQFDLSVPHAKFLANLSMDFASIQSQEYAEAMQKADSVKAFYEQPIGTGPFAVRQSKGNNILYAENPTYWANVIPKSQPHKLVPQYAEPEITGTD